MLWLHELPVNFDRWVDLDVDGIPALQKPSSERRAIQDQRTMAALTLALRSNGAEKRDGIQNQNCPVGKPSTAVVAEGDFIKSIEDLPE